MDKIGNLSLEPKKPEKSDSVHRRNNFNLQPADSLNDTNKAIISFYRTLPWIKEKITSNYIAPLNIPETFFDKNKSYNHEGTTFYEVTPSYFILRSVYRKSTKMISDDIINLERESEIYSFKVGFITRNKFYVQTKKMFDQETELINKFLSSGIDISKIKNAPVTKELKAIALNLLQNITPNNIYSENVVKRMEYYSKNSYEFSYKLATLLLAEKYDEIFSKQLRKGYFDVDNMHQLFNDNSINWSIYFSSLEMSQEDYVKIKSAIEDYTYNLLIQSYRYYDIPVRKTTISKQQNILKMKSLNIKSKCQNMSDVIDVDEENLTFLEMNNNLFCYDLKKLYFDFQNGNYTNSVNGKNFPQSFIEKVSTLYKFNKPLIAPTTQLLDIAENRTKSKSELVKEERFKKLLRLIREDVENFPLSNNSKTKCDLCKNIVGNMGMKTLDSKGKSVLHCSQQCFDKFKSE